jgi:hypothetical protein
MMASSRLVPTMALSLIAGEFDRTNHRTSVTGKWQIMTEKPLEIVTKCDKKNAIHEAAKVFFVNVSHYVVTA